MPRRLLLAVCAIAFVPCFVACGDDDDDDSGSNGDTGATVTSSAPAVSASTASPTLSGPAGKYSVSIDDLGINWLTDIKGTFEIDTAALVADYAERSRVFEDENEGLRKLREWGYVEGYETGYIPEVRDRAVLAGSFYIVIETHLFATKEGAMKAFEYFSKTPLESGALPLEVEGVGNAAAGFVTVAGKIGGSNVNAMYHQVVFVRGNAVEIVLTKGAQGFMKIDPAWELARMADAKLLGERSAIEPTPTSNYKTPTPAPKP